jgi:hypothetical protein
MTMSHAHIEDTLEDIDARLSKVETVMLARFGALIDRLAARGGLGRADKDELALLTELYANPGDDDDEPEDGEE